MNPNDPGYPINSPHLHNEYQETERRNLDGPLHVRYHTGQLQRHNPPEDHSARPNSPASTYSRRALDREPGLSGMTRYSESSHRAIQYEEPDHPLDVYPYPQTNANYGGEMNTLHSHHPPSHGSRYPPPQASDPVMMNTSQSISMPAPHSDSTNLNQGRFPEHNAASTSYHHPQQAPQPHHVIQGVPHLRQSRSQEHDHNRSLLFPQEYSPSLDDRNTAPGQTSSLPERMRFMQSQLASYDAGQSHPAHSHLAAYESPLPTLQARSALQLQVRHNPGDIGATTVPARSHSTNMPTTGGYDTMHASSSIPMSNTTPTNNRNNNTTSLPNSSDPRLFSASNWPQRGYEYGIDGTSAPLGDASFPTQAMGSSSTRRSFASGSSVTMNLLAHDDFPGRHNSQYFHPSSSTHSLSSSHSSLGPSDSPGPISDSDTPLDPGRDEMGDHTSRERESRPQLGSPVNSVSDTGGKKGEDTDKAGKKKRKSKMHQCEVCKKSFPRPSGLKTHMNTHNNAKPYECYVPGCNRKFGVRSNAKRHLRTHGIVNPQPTATTGFAGFSTPVILQDPNRPHGQESDSHPSGSGGNGGGSTSTPLRWVPFSLASRTNASRLGPVRERWHPSRGMGVGHVDGPGMDGVDDADDEDDEDDEDAVSRLSIPLQSSVPSDSQGQIPLPPPNSFPFTFTSSFPSSHPNLPMSSSSSIPTSSDDRSRRQLDPRAVSHPYSPSQPPRHPES